MTIKDLFDYFTKEDNPAFFIVDVFSWRGAYEDVAFTIAIDQGSKEESLNLISKALTNGFRGYHGGTFRYTLDTNVHFERSSSAFEDRTLEDYLSEWCGDMEKKVSNLREWTDAMWVNKHENTAITTGDADVVTKACEWMNRNGVFEYLQRNGKTADEIKAGFSNFISDRGSETGANVQYKSIGVALEMLGKHISSHADNMEKIGGTVTGGDFDEIVRVLAETVNSHLRNVGCGHLSITEG